MILTIAIPTYNRNEILLKTLESLLPQLAHRTRLLVLDNCSKVPVAETLTALLASYPEADCRIVRHRANVGGNTNILRCFELCETEWMWTLGDDDVAKPDAVETILREIAEHEDCVFMNFYSSAEPYVRSQTYLTHGIADFVNRMDNFGNVLFLSCGVYRIAPLLPQLNIACHHTYSCAPHIALTLASLGKSRGCCFSARQVVDWGGPLPAEQQFSNLSVCLGMATLLELSMPSAVRRALGQRMLSTLNYWMAKRNLFGLILVAAVKDRDTAGARFTFDQIRSRIYYYEKGLVPRLATRLCALLLRNPPLVFALLSVPYRLWKGRNFGSLPEQNRWDRV